MEAEPRCADRNLHQVKLITDIIDYIQQGGLSALKQSCKGEECSFTARQCCILTAVQCLTAKLGRAVTHSDLARDLHMSPSATSHIIDTLVENELLVRHTHADDRRSILISLTPRGERCATASRRGMLRAIHRLTSELTPEENELRLRMTDKLYRIAYPPS